MVANKNCTRLCIPCLGIGLGLAYGILMMLFAWAGWIWGFAATAIDQASLVFRGYGPHFMGGVIGFGWGLLEGFVIGVIIAAVYNCCMGCCKMCAPEATTGNNHRSR